MDYDEFAICGRDKMSAFDLMEINEMICKCPQCDKDMKYNEPLPSCNECECCFCSEECRELFHLEEETDWHDYTKPLPDIS